MLLSRPLRDLTEIEQEITFVHFPGHESIQDKGN